MEKWKDLYFSMNFMDCIEVNGLLSDKKLNSKIVSTSIIKHNNPGNPFQQVGCSKVVILEKDFEKGLKIISENGYKSDIPFTDGSPIEHSMPFPKQN
jgi:hypothetical protein